MVETFTERCVRGYRHGYSFVVCFYPFSEDLDVPVGGTGSVIVEENMLTSCLEELYTVSIHCHLMENYVNFTC